MVIEWISRLTDKFEVHIYSQNVEDVDLSKITWHRVPKLKGPHLFNFSWWFVANYLWRRRDSLFGSLNYKLTLSPGPNCFDADAISVHIVFAEFLSRMKLELRFTRNPISSWPVLLHRKLYYRVATILERRAYTNPKTQLILTSPHTVEEMKRFFGTEVELPVVSAGLDHQTFNPQRSLSLRETARQALCIPENCFAALLIGNDLRKKGIRGLLGALRRLRNLQFDLIVVGRENPAQFRAMIGDAELEKRVHFVPVRRDVEYYYAAADAYVGPSLEDTFALPAAEAMACGLPVIVSAKAGAADLITHGEDGFILHDPTDDYTLASMILRLYEDRNLCARVGEAAAKTAGRYTWDRSSRELAAVLERVLQRKCGPEADANTRYHDLQRPNSIAGRKPYSPKKYWSDLAARSHFSDATELAPILHPYAPAWFNRLIDGLQFRAVRRALMLGNVRPGAHILDVGCGLGRWVRRFEELGLQVTGVDATHAMLCLARERGERAPLVAGEAQRLPFRDAQFDCVSDITVTQHIPTSLQAHAISEMVRVLKPGGRAILMELIRGKGPHIFPRTATDWVDQAKSHGLNLVGWFGQEYLLLDRLVVHAAQAITAKDGYAAEPRGFLAEPASRPSFIARQFYWACRRIAAPLSAWTDPIVARIFPRQLATHGVFVFQK